MLKMIKTRAMDYNSPVRRIFPCLLETSPLRLKLGPARVTKVSLAWTSGSVNTLTHLAEDAPSRRRGPKGYFQGSRKEFLEDQLPKYLACKKGSRQDFWHRLYSAWWLRFPWRLEDTREPPTDHPERMIRLAAVAPGDEAEKILVEEALTEVRLIFVCSLSKLIESSTSSA